MSHPHPPIDLADDADGLPRRRGSALMAEAFGTLLVVFAIVGTALLSGSFLDPANGVTGGVGLLGVAIAAGCSLIVAGYAFGPISGGHFNPAVTLGLAAAGRFPWRRVAPYVAAQTVGGLVASTFVVLIALGGPATLITTVQDGGFASNGWGALSPGGFGVTAAVVTAFVLTALLVLVVLGVTHPVRGAPALAGVFIGLAYLVLHLIALPVDYASANPARSIATALYGGAEAVAQLWLFLALPAAGALAAGVAYRALFDSPAPRA